MSLSKDANWWRQAAVYQIYPRSFKDSNGDGIGDLKGITSKVTYLQSLSLDAVWLSPFYPSALADGGYDVDDYRNVDPKLGTLDDFDEMLAALHNVGIRVFVDIVPNHSSNRHEWFIDALNSDPGSPERARYIFRDGKGKNGELPPSDWPSHFAPSAWTRITEKDGKLGQWYCHLFAPEQPDLNWDNPEVEADFIKTLRFWADRGVDGFRVDVAHAMKKDLSEPLRSQPTLGYENPQFDGKGVFFDRTELFEVYKEWRKVFNEYDPPRVAVAEANVPIERMPLYASDKTLGQAFNFAFLDAKFDPVDYKDTVQKSLEIADKNRSSSTWVLSNHDKIRHATRYGLHPVVNEKKWLLADGLTHPLDREVGTRAALAATMFILALPGCTYMYQGEELGLHEVTDIPHDQIQDPAYAGNLFTEKGRDGCRVPLPWNGSGTSYGFGSGGSHLPQPAWFATVNVASQDGVVGTPLEIYRKALALRKELQSEELLMWHETKNREVLHFSRPGGWNCMINFRAHSHAFTAKEILHSSAPLDGFVLPAATTVWFRVS
jgi:alpha-glucosidase